VKLLCRVLTTDRGSYYTWVRALRKRRERQHDDQRLIASILEVHTAHPAYGVPRVTRELQRQGIPVGRRIVTRLMQQNGISGVTRRKRRNLTRPDEGVAAVPDLIRGEFTAPMPGHWEGDLLIGLQRSAIGTLVERSTRFTMLIHLPREEGFGVIPRTKNGPPLAGYGALAMKNALAATITTLPEQLRRSITWDRGKELSAHAQFRIETGIPVYFADPHSPWQRGTNENTYWCTLGGPGSFDGRSQAGPPGDSENTCLRASR
jgi:transposase InsO family protein